MLPGTFIGKGKCLLYLLQNCIKWDDNGESELYIVSNIIQNELRLHFACINIYLEVIVLSQQNKMLLHVKCLIKASLFFI